MTKNIFSKILSAISAAMLVVGLAVPAFSTNAASATFNNASNDLKTLQIANSTKSAGSFSWAATTTADGNDAVAFLVYYHNTSTATANNTKIRINLPTSAAKSQKISTNIWADNASSIYDFATLDISTSQTLTLIPGSVKWYPNQGSTAQALPSGQTGDEIVSFNGLNIGNINGGWTTQGYITLKAQVSNNSATAAYAPSVTTYSATNIATTSATLNGITTPNGASTTAWFEYGTSAASLTSSTTSQNMGSGTAAASIAANLTGLTANTTYYFRAVAQNSQGTTNGSVLSFTTNFDGNTNTNIGNTGTGTAQFNNDLKDSKTIQVANSTKSAGSFSWTTSTTADGNDAIAILVYYHNTSGNTAKNTKVRVNIPSTNSKSQTVSVNLWADNASSMYDFATINISSSQNITFINDSVKWYPNQGSTAQALPSGQNGNEIVSFNGLNLGDINGGWTTQGYITLKAQISNNSNIIANAPTAKTYAATNIATTAATLNGMITPNGATTNAWFEYGTSATALTNSTTAQDIGSGSLPVSIAANLTGLTANTTYYFRAVAQNSQGTTNGSVLSFTTAIDNSPIILVPTVTTNSAIAITTTTATLNGQVNPNNASTNAWFEYGTSVASLTSSTTTQIIGSSSSAVILTANLTGLASNTTYYFRAVAQNSAGTTNGAVLSFTTQTSATAPVATTNAATNIASTASTLNGMITPNGASTTAWFEYGTSAASLTSSTASQNMGSGTAAASIAANLTGLTANTTYYFRAVAQNSQGTTNGSVLSFTTTSVALSAPSVTTVAASSITTTSATLNGTVNPNNIATTAWFEYGTSATALINATSTQSLGSGSSVINITQQITGLTSGTTYYFRAVAQNSAGTTNGAVLSFTTQTTTSTSAPSVTTNSATIITTTDATLNSQINPNGQTTNAWFEYGTSATSLTYATSTQNIGAGTASLSVISAITGLSANTTYYFRAVAQNSAGTTNGAVLSFTTNGLGGGGGGGGGGGSSSNTPIVTTNSATSISTTSASFSGLVNPNNSTTTAWFEYGTSAASLNNSTSVQDLGTGTSSINIGATVSNLIPNTTYYFRAVARNVQGTISGQVMSFATASDANATAPAITTNAATSITSNLAMLNATINPKGSAAVVSFEYGVSATNLDKTSLSQTINGNSYVPVSIAIAGLAANTTYHFRPMVKNSVGTTYGATNSFTTSSATAATTVAKTAQKAKTSTAINSNYPDKPYIDIANGLTVENLTSSNGNGTTNFANIGDKLKYTIVVKNTGGATGYGIKVSDQFSSALKYIESSPKADFDSVANVVSWNIVKLASGESQTMSFTVEVQSGLDTTIDNQAKEYLSFANLNVYSNTVSTLTIKQKPISVKLSADKTEVKSGEILNYSLTIKNANNYNLNNFLLSVGLPENVELQEADFTVFNKSEKSLIIDLGSVAADQEITKKLSVKVTDQVKEGDILTLIAIANYQDAAGNTQPIVSASISTTVASSLNIMASIFGGIKSLSGMQWVILFGSLIAVLGGSFAGRKLYRRYRTVKVKIQQV